MFTIRIGRISVARTFLVGSKSSGLSPARGSACTCPVDGEQTLLSPLNNSISDSATTKEIVMAELKEAPRPKTENGPGQTKDIAPRNSAAPMKSTGSPYAYMRRFAQEMDHLFENFGLQTGMRMPSFLTRGHELLRREAGFVPGTWSPHVDVFERNGQFMVKADLPGQPRGHQGGCRGRPAHDSG